MNTKQIVFATAIVLVIAAFSIPLGTPVSSQNATNMTSGMAQGNASPDNTTGMFQDMASARIPKG